MNPPPVPLWLRLDTDWLANISVKWVLVAVGMLLLLRAMLARSDDGRRQATDSVAEFVESALIAIVLVFLIIRPFVVQAFYIPSESMKPTLDKGDRILVNKFIYHFGRPQRGDVVVFRAPHQVSYDEKDFIKRIVAVPGDVVQAVPDRILADDRLVLSLNSKPEIIPEAPARSLSPAGIVNPKVDVPSGHVTVISTAGYNQEVYLGDPATVQIDGSRVTMGSRVVANLEPGDRAEISYNVSDQGGDPQLHGAVVLVNNQPRVLVVEARKLTIDRGHLILNGQELRERTIEEPPNYDMPPTTVPEGQYWVMGDNRNDSNDSHQWGGLEGDRIIGRAQVIFWPPRRMTLIR